MEPLIDAKSRSALKADSPVRCLYRGELLFNSRQPKDVKIWADGLVDTVLKGVGRDVATSSKELLIIQIHRENVRICFDIFPWDCSSQIRHVERSNEPPIYEIYKIDEVYHMRRNKSLDARVGAEYMRLQALDKGERPYFYDVDNPPVYDEHGRLLEGFRYGDGTEDSEAEEPQLSSSLGITATCAVVMLLGVLYWWCREEFS